MTGDRFGSDPDGDGPRGRRAADPEVVLVAAVAANGVIGRDGEMPWHYPEDLRHFRETTTGHPVILGRRTYEAVAGQVGGPLPDRTNVVLSSTPERLPDEVVGVDGVDAALAAARETGSDVAYVVGGEAVYRQFLPLADRLILTELHESYEGDSRFPEFDRDEWREANRDRREEFDFVEYERVGRRGP